MDILFWKLYLTCLFSKFECIVISIVILLLKKKGIEHSFPID